MDRRNRNILIALLFSLLFHLGVLYLIDFFDWLMVTAQTSQESIPEEITVIFPENKVPPAKDKEMYIVENQNENEMIPDDANLLSDRNSRASNPDITPEIMQNTPQSQGNVDLQELSQSKGQENPVKPFNYKPFSSKALTGKQVDATNADGQSETDTQSDDNSEMQQAGLGTNQKFNQQKFSVEEVGALSLSTYAWEWAPYIRKLKNKHTSVWFAPPAYNRLGLIHGYTKIAFEIDRSGNLVRAEVIDHKGHESLKISSMESIKAIFPFLPLPDNFPDPTLKITATLIYPDLRRRR